MDKYCLDYRKNNKVIKETEHLYKGEYLMRNDLFIMMNNKDTTRYTMGGYNIVEYLNPQFRKQFMEDYAVISLLDTRWNFPAMDVGGLFDIILKVLQILKK